MPTPAKPIPAGASSYQSASHFFPSSPIAQQAIAQDIEEFSDDGGDQDYGEPSSDEESEASISRPMGQNHSMTSTYQRPSYVAYGGGRSTVTPQIGESGSLTKTEKRKIRDQERSLLRDNHLAPPKHPHQPPPGPFMKIWKQLFGTRRPKQDGDMEAAVPSFTAEPSETSALLPNGEAETDRDRRHRENRIWEEAVASGRITTTWQREAKTLGQYSSPLVITFVLQYSLTVASIFTIGHIGKVELGAVSLASMTANITGYAIYQGLATSLDTLCAQAYGSGNRKLVGLQ